MEKKPLVLDDSYSQTLTYRSQCMRCRYFITEGHCKAYPDGIPMSIWSAKETHDMPREGDHGIQFEESYSYKK